MTHGVLPNHPWITIMRPAVCILTVFGAFVGALLVTIPRGDQVDWFRLVVALIGAFAVAMSTMITNDVADRKIDAIEKPDRPIPAGKISENMASTVGISGYFLAIVCGTIVSVELFVIYCGIVAISVHYNYGGKGLPMVGNVEVAACVASIPIFGAASQGRPFDLWFLWCFMFVFEIGRELAVTIQDVEADREQGLKTMPVIIGREASGILAITFYFFSLPFLYFCRGVPGFGPIFVLGSVALVGTLIGTMYKVAADGYDFESFEIWIRTRGRFFILIWEILLLVEVFL